MKLARRHFQFRSFFCVVAFVCIAANAFARQPGTPLAFDDARALLITSAPSLKAAQARFAGKRDTTDSLKGLNYPEVGLELRYFRYEHTINNKQADIDSLSVNGNPVPLSALGLGSYEARLSQTALQPLATASWVLYSGGEITAAKRAASAAAEQAGAQLDAVREALDLELVRAYFGQQLASRVLVLRKELLEGMREHLDNAIKLEKGGLVTKAQRLQAQVACDAAQRGCDVAEHSVKNARIGLSAILHSNEPFEPTTQLFVIKQPIASLATFVVGARERNPRVRAIESLKRAAEQGVKAERARWMPKVLAFGSYNFDKDSETLVDTDWMAGIGVRWSVFDRIDRRKSYSAAKQTVAEAAESAEHARMLADAGARQAYDGLASALRQFELLESNLESARENLRVQEVSFKEGQGISTDVTNARIALTNVLVERAVAAYQFDLELAKLLHASGQMDQFSAYMRQADVIIP
ncbi:outer membrane protein TolC [Ereboglobus sp. PH5-5]|uniref:TolC family protein n=1 Tax=Ereboglobus sp. PH5-5 TaxID=2940529 RepID=UPI00240773BA|nr:TolC family protein [Ereboglobus sp. PH5-5]MDF9831878.1 outer membrane protein TolC [Ereboglobus sp. PH5-5]